MEPVRGHDQGVDGDENLPELDGVAVRLVGAALGRRSSLGRRGLELVFVLHPGHPAAGQDQDSEGGSVHVHVFFYGLEGLGGGVVVEDG